MVQTGCVALRVSLDEGIILDPKCGKGPVNDSGPYPDHEQHSLATTRRSSIANVAWQGDARCLRCRFFCGLLGDTEISILNQHRANYL